MLRHYVAIGYSGYLRGPAILRDRCSTGLCITPAAGLQYAKSRLTEEDSQRRLEFAEEWSHPEKLAQLKLALFSDEYTVQNSPGKPGQWVFWLV
jgi:hypothetical protein